MDTTQKQGTAPNQSFSAGEMVASRYKIIRLLGVGGMGCVYLAEDTALKSERIAIKILHQQLSFDEKYSERFLREVQLMRKVNHPNVVRTFDFGADKQAVYFTMEFVAGKSLLECIQKKLIQPSSYVSLIMQICSGLASIHQAGILHRDLKPENILILEHGTAKITDFGVARTETSELTAHNEIVGSAPYMAPEVWLGEKLSASVDLYSLGIILYELVTQELPFDAEVPATVMREHLYQKPKPPRDFDRNIPQWLNLLILRLLEKSAYNRPRSAVEIIQMLKRVGGDSARISLQALAGEVSASTTIAAAYLESLEERSQRAASKLATTQTTRETQAGTVNQGQIQNQIIGMASKIKHVTLRRIALPKIKKQPLVFALLSPINKRLLSVTTVSLCFALTLWYAAKFLKTQYFIGYESAFLEINLRSLAAVQSSSTVQFIWQYAVKGLLFLFATLFPLSVCAALARDLQVIAKLFLVSLGSLSGIFAGYFGILIWPAIRASSLNSFSIANAFFAAGQWLHETVTFSEKTVKFSATVLNGGMVLTPSDALLLNSLPRIIGSCVYALIFLYVLRRVAQEEIIKRELVYSAWAIILLTIYLMQWPVPEGYLLGPIDAMYAFPISLTFLAAAKLVFSLFVIGVLLPLVAGEAKKRYHITNS